jgi:hypothetical protein
MIKVTRTDRTWYNDFPLFILTEISLPSEHVLEIMRGASHLHCSATELLTIPKLQFLSGRHFHYRVRENLLDWRISTPK